MDDKSLENVMIENADEPGQDPFRGRRVVVSEH